MAIRWILLVGALAMLAVSAMAQTTPPPRTIMVTGQAERMVAPDVANIVLAIETQANTVAQAVEQNTRLTNRVMDAIRRLNIQGLTMSTLGFDVQPMYEQITQPRTTTQPPRIVGYRVVNRLRVRIPDADATRLSTAVGRVLDAALAAGANRVDEVSFSLADETAATLDLIAEATRNARSMASALASAAGVQLGQVLSLSTSPMIQPPIPLYARTAEAAQASVPIVAGPVTVRATVSVVYEIR